MVKKQEIGEVMYRFLLLAFMAAVIGGASAMASIGFVELVIWFNDVLLISPRSRVQFSNQSLLITLTVLVPTLGGLVVGLLIHKFTSVKRPLGPADVIRAVQLREPMPQKKGGLIATLASTISIGCGASVGQYGPLVYLGALLGSFVERFNLRIPNIQAIAISCGVAASIATVFNAPIAGLVFAHELILRHYSLQAFAPTTVAAATGYVIANVVFQRPPLFLVAFDGVNHWYEFIIFAILGILCALLAVIFMRSIFASAKFATRIAVKPWLKPALAGMVLGLVALQLPDVLGIGKEALRFATIEGAFSNLELLLLVVAKIGLTAICIGFGFAGGVFSPSLLIGILFGALFWGLLEVLGINNSGVVVYAIGGMMALASPVIGAPLTTILIVFELTRNYDLTIAAMVSVVFANLLAYRLFGRSFFDVQLIQRGVDLSFGRDRAILEQAKIVDRSLDDFLAFPETTKVDILIEQLQDAGRAEAVIVDNDGKYLGMFRIQDVQLHHSQALSTVMRTDALTFNETTTLWQAMLGLKGFVGENIPVVHSSSAELLGVMTEGDLIEAYLDTIHDLRREENEAV